MTKLSNGNIATDLDNATDNHTLTAKGYTIRHIEDWANHGSIIVWDGPVISEADLTF